MKTITTGNILNILDLLQNLYTQVTFTSNLVAENWGSGLI